MSEKTKTSEDCSRRQFFTHISYTLGGLAAVMVGIPIVGSVLAPIVKQPKPIWRPVGELKAFTVGDIVKVSFIDSSPLPWAGVNSRDRCMASS